MKSQTIQLTSIPSVMVLVALIFPFTVDAAAPTVNTGNAIVNGNFVTLSGTADPNGEATVAWFVWGPESSGGSRSTNRIDVGSGNSQVNYGYLLENLDYNTNYTYQAVARSTLGVISGTKRTFSTPVGPGFSNTSNQTGATQTQGTKPIVITNLATNTTEKTLRLNGTVIPGSEILTSGWFEWGPTQALGHATEKKDRGIGGSVNFGENMPGLAGGITYYFRAVGETQHGRAYGSILSFHTKGSTAAEPVPTSTPTPQLAPKKELVPEPGTCTCDGEAKGESTQEASAFVGFFSAFPGNVIAWLSLLILLLIIAYTSLHVYEKIKHKQAEKQQTS